MRRLKTMASRYMKSRARWVAAGKPERSDEKVKQLLNEVCIPCRHSRPISKRRKIYQCGLCYCSLNLGDTLNKLRWATEPCPDNPPRFPADVVVEDDQVAIAEKVLTGREIRRNKRLKRRARQMEKELRAAQAKAEDDKITGHVEGDWTRVSREERKKAPPVIELPQNDDPLYFYDRYKNPIGHVLRDLWRPCPGFLVCGGPSLKRLDLSLLKQRGIVSLGVNNVAGFAPVKAFTFSDPPEKFHQGIFFDPNIMKLVPIAKLFKRVRAKVAKNHFEWTTFRVADCPNVYGYRRDSVWDDPAEFLHREFATWGCGDICPAKNKRHKILFTFFLGLRLMHYLGCPRVYLLGVDFGMAPGETGGYAFGQARTQGAANGNNNTYRIAAEMLAELKPHLDAAGFEVYNCNEKSNLTCFPYVPYETAIADACSMLPGQDFDLSQWYEKPGEKADYRG